MRSDTSSALATSRVVDGAPGASNLTGSGQPVGLRWLLGLLASARVNRRTRGPRPTSGGPS